jgi:hypothetical protein
MLRSTLFFFAILAASGAAACTASVAGDPSSTGSNAASCIAADGHPTTLACTGLYTDTPTGEIGQGVSAYAPSVSLWADGATKSRFIQLPAGTQIDTSDMDHWVFPNGTKLWKEFSLGGQKIETRFLQKQSDGTWFRTVYAWSADGTEATEVTTGVTNVNGSGYDIPSQGQCAECHDGEPGGVLGFEAIGLSTPGATGLTMAALVAQGLVTNAPAAPIAIPGTATESAALGWLHANCGNACHNRSAGAMASSTGLFMRLEIAQLQSVQSTDTYTTAVGVVSGFQPLANETFDRIAPGNLNLSAIVYRASRRDTPQDPTVQMPPLGTNVVDTQGVALVEAWISGM